MRTKIFFLLTVSVLFITSTQFAQTSNEKSAERHLISLKNGTLILVLDSQKQKIEAITDLLSKMPSTHSKYKYYSKQLIEIDSTLEVQKLYHDIIRKEYTYSDIKVMWDDDLHKLMNDSFNFNFLDENLVEDPSIKIDKDRGIYTLKYSSSNRTINFGTDAWLIRTRYLEEIKSPFPGYYKYKLSFLDGFMQFFGIEPYLTHHRIRAKEITQMMNEKLRAY